MPTKETSEYFPGDKLLVYATVKESGHNDSIFVLFKTESERAQLKQRDVYQVVEQMIQVGDVVSWTVGNPGGGTDTIAGEVLGKNRNDKGECLLWIKVSSKHNRAIGPEFFTKDQRDVRRMISANVKAK